MNRSFTVSVVGVLFDFLALFSMLSLSVLSFRPWCGIYFSGLLPPLLLAGSGECHAYTVGSGRKGGGSLSSTLRGENIFLLP